jgi:phage gp29-like protein
MVEFNFGPSAPVPSFAFAVDPAADLDKLSERLDRFVSIGGKVSQRTARNLLQIPDPEPGDELLAQPKAPAPTPPTFTP